MLDNNNLQTRTCPSASLGQKLMYLFIGGGVGACVALLFAPTSGRDLRSGISDVVTDGYARTMESANQLKALGEQYYGAAKETGTEVLDVVASGMSTVSEEIRGDVAKINRIVSSKRHGRMGSANVL